MNNNPQLVAVRQAIHSLRLAINELEAVNEQAAAQPRLYGEDIETTLDTVMLRSGFLAQAVGAAQAVHYPGTP